MPAATTRSLIQMVPPTRSVSGWEENGGMGALEGARTGWGEVEAKAPASARGGEDGICAETREAGASSKEDEALQCVPTKRSSKRTGALSIYTCQTRWWRHLKPGQRTHSKIVCRPRLAIGSLALLPFLGGPFTLSWDDAMLRTPRYESIQHTLPDQSMPLLR